jgi:hypothetical protein
MEEADEPVDRVTLHEVQIEGATTTPIEPRMASNVISRGGTPAITSIAATVNTMMIDVPRSGCTTIEERGTADITRSRTTSYIVSPSGLRWQ